MGIRSSRTKHAGWYSPDKGFVDPSSFSSPLGVRDGVVCLVRGLYDSAVSLHALGDRPDAPAFNGSKAGKLADGYVLVLSAVGAPALSMVMEEMISSGVKRMLILGIAGTISNDCRIGDVVVPTWGIREEGTSYHYLPADEEVRPSPGMLSSVRRAFSDLKFVEGGVWSVDAPYRETKGKVDSYSAKGAVAVEMECTAAMAIAKHRGIDLACVLGISDELTGDTWKMGFESEELVHTMAEICRRIPAVFG